MNVVVNGETRLLDEGATLADVLRDIGVAVDSRGVAVARNGTVVTRSEWSTLSLDSGDQLEVLHAVQGG